jgi:Type IV secretion-system coupling protein DNA-binding domain
MSNPISFVKKDKLNFDITAPLLKFMGESWTIGDACEGVQIFGGTGSGKTSGSGQSLAKCYLYNGFGGLVLTVKSGDREMWEEYSKTVKREVKLVVVNETTGYRFNFLDYLVKEGYSTVNIAHTFLSVMQKVNAGDYWQNAMEQMIKNVINLLIVADGEVSIGKMYKAILNAPRTIEEANAIFNNQAIDPKNSKETDYFKDLVFRAMENYERYIEQVEAKREAQQTAKLEGKMEEANTLESEESDIEVLDNQADYITDQDEDQNEYTDEDEDEDEETYNENEETYDYNGDEIGSSQDSNQDFDDKLESVPNRYNHFREFDELTLTYWQTEFPNMASKPRSSIISMFTSLADNLLRGELRRIMSCEPSEANFRPEDTFKGKVIVLDLSIKRFRETGKMAQIIFKTIFQMAVERKREHVLDKSKMRPVFLWIDEAQFFLTSSDVLFQTTARSSKICSVYLTQNLSNYLAFVNSDREEATINSFLSVLQTKFFHCQSDIRTNEYFTSLIGKTYQPHHSTTTGYQDGRDYTTTTKSHTLDYQVLPWQLDQLAKGGPNNKYVVEAYLYQSGRTWGNHRTNYGLVEFNQNLRKGEE